jgi:hypothetical protein
VKVIGSGFGRTGTLSMKVALEQLGFGPCYHMEEVVKRPKHIQLWHNVAYGKPVDWHALFQNFQATVDFPASVVYKELMEAFPEAKIVHTVRDPERWYDSTYETIYQANSLFPSWLRKVVPIVSHFTQMERRLIWLNLFEGNFEDRQRAIEIFHQHTEAVKSTVPADRLLIFNVNEGWEPLCQFLGVPVPDTPFPHVNGRDAMLRRFKWLHVTFHYGPVVLAVLLLSVLIGILSTVGT